MSHSLSHTLTNVKTSCVRLISRVGWSYLTFYIEYVMIWADLDL